MVEFDYNDMEEDPDLAMMNELFMAVALREVAHVAFDVEQQQEAATTEDDDY
jgi:hypothetical protein